MSTIFKREPLTSDEANRLSNACEAGMERLVIWTLLDTGLRVSELANLNKNSIDWQSHILRIYGKGGPWGKQTKWRVVPMSPRVQTLIESHFSLHDSIGIKKRAMQRLVKKVANRACISRPCTPHVLRHTFACSLAQKGVHLSVVQKILGHDNLETTEIYLNMHPEDVIRAFKEHW